MNLSLVKKLGMVHVRAGRLLAVAHEHQVPTHTQSGADPKEYQRIFADDEKWVTAKIGNLAVEIVAAKTDKLLGYSYLTGPAIRLHLYRASSPAHWFSPARAVRANLSQIPPIDQVEQVIGGFMHLKYHVGAQAIVMEAEVQSEDSMHNAVKVFETVYKYIPGEMTDEHNKVDQTAAHFIGKIGIRNKKAPFCLLHLQPPRDAMPWACSGFQNMMMLEGNWDVVDPWKARQIAVG